MQRRMDVCSSTFLLYLIGYMYVCMILIADADAFSDIVIAGSGPSTSAKGNSL